MELIRIKDKEYKIRVSLSTLIYFQHSKMGLGDVPQLTDDILLYYAALKSANKGMLLTFDEFLEALDEDVKLLKQLKKVVMPLVQEFTKQLNDDDEEDVKKKAE